MNQIAENFKRSDPKKTLQGAARAWLLKTNIPPGIQQWVDFHHNHLSQMNLERWGNAAPNWRSPILGSLYARTYIEESFRKHLNWKTSNWTDLKNPLMRLAISDYNFLKRLATFSGALIASETIRKIVDRKTVQMLRKELGEEVLYFARVQAAHLDLDLFPEKFLLKNWSPSQGIAALLNAGWILIACASALLPAGEWRQFLNRLPQSIEESWNQNEFSDEDFQMSWKCLQPLIQMMKEQK